MQNIGAGNADDAFYRYKMPKLVAKVEGRGNGIKTNVVNNVDVAKALERSPEYVLKFFGCELGAQTNYDAKSGTCIVNGAHDINKLNELLEGFIKRYVQCYSCGNPETIMKIKKDDIFLKCKACGAVSDVDMRHKLNTFILKNPPENKLRKEEIKLKKAEEQRLADAQALEKKEKKEKKERKSERGENGEKKEKKEKKDKKKKKKEGDAEGDEGEGSGDAEKDEGANSSESAEEEADDGVVWMTDTSAEAVKKRAEEQLTAATAAMVTQGNIEAEQAEQRRKEREAVRKAEEEAAAAAEKAAAEKAAAEKAANEKAQAERDAADAAAAAKAAEELSASAARLSVNGNGVKAAAGSAGGDVARLLPLLAGKDAAAAVAAELKTMSVEGGLAGRMRVLYAAVFSASDDKVAAALKASAKVLKPHSADVPGQLAQLIALEHYLSVTAPERVKETPLALKALYDLDLVEDDTIIAWAGKADAGKILGVPAEGGAAVRAAAAPVVDWLQEEEDSEEDEEEDLVN